jgi:hypothetical protein
VPYIHITVPAGTAIGKTVAAQIGAKPERVTLLNEQVLRIEPDEVCAILSATTQDGRITIAALSKRGGGR